MGGMGIGRAGWETTLTWDRIWASREKLRGGLVDLVYTTIDDDKSGSTRR